MIGLPSKWCSIAPTITMAALCLLTACLAPPPPLTNVLPIIEGPPPPTLSTPYKIGAGDELAIKFFYAPELNETLQVRPDGKISLQFIQDVTAAGLTPETLGKEIRHKLRRIVKQPDLVVVVRNATANKAYISGEVSKSGPVPLRGGETLMQVLSEAGWVMPTANRQEVALVRRDTQGRPQVYELNIDHITSGEDPSHNITVQAGDVIMVPPSDITYFDRWVDQHIRLATPIPGSFVFTNQTNAINR